MRLRNLMAAAGCIVLAVAPASSTVLAATPAASIGLAAAPASSTVLAANPAASTVLAAAPASSTVLAAIPAASIGPAAAPANAGKPHLKGKNLFTLFDSLGQTGVWQERLAELSGMNFDKEGNFNYFCPISYGGACTGLYGPVSGMQRARNLVEVSKTRSVDYLMFENTNDIGQFSNLGTLDDHPWFWSYTKFVNVSELQPKQAAGSMTSKQDAEPKQIDLNSKQDAEAYWKANFSAIVGAMKPETGAVARVPYVDGGISCEVEVLSGTTADGILNVHCREFLIPIPVKAGLNAEQLTDYLMTVALRPGCDCIRTSATSMSLRDYIKGVNTFTFDCGDTGIVLKINEGTGLATYDRFFTGKDTSEWMNPDCWTSAPTLYAQWKGFVEYLQAHFPKAKMYLFIPTYYMCSPQNEKIKGAYFEAMEALAAHYGIPVLDVAAASGITPENVLDFYEQGNVHPKDAGYRRWGETAYKLLSK